MSDLKKVGRIGVKSLIYFEVVTTLSLAIGILLAYLIQPRQDRQNGPAHRGRLQIYPAGRGRFSWPDFFSPTLPYKCCCCPSSWGSSSASTAGREKIIGWLEPATRVVFMLLNYVMWLAPLGAFGGMAFTIGKFGIRTLLPLGKLMLSVYCTMAIFIFGVLGLILRYYKLNIWTYLKNIKEEILVVLGTSSSEAALPSLMSKLEQMGCSKPVVGLVVPTGYSFNLDGTSIYLSMATLFLAQLYNVPLSFGEMLGILGILMVTSKGAAGVTGSGFTVLASTLTAIHKIPVEGLAFLLAVDRFMSEARAITNIIGNGVATLVVAKSEGEFAYK